MSLDFSKMNYALITFSIKMLYSLFMISSACLSNHLYTVYMCFSIQEELLGISLLNLFLLLLKVALLVNLNEF